MKKFLKYFLLVIITGFLALWIYCRPVTVLMANSHFDKYIEEYNIPKEDIAYRKSSKGYMFAPVYVVVHYKSDPDYVYRYAYDVGRFSDIRPRYVIIRYQSPHTYMGANSLYENGYYDVKYPPASQTEDYRIKPE